MPTDHTRLIMPLVALVCALIIGATVFIDLAISGLLDAAPRDGITLAVILFMHWRFRRTLPAPNANEES